MGVSVEENISDRPIQLHSYLTDIITIKLLGMNMLCVRRRVFHNSKQKINKRKICHKCLVRRDISHTPTPTNALVLYLFHLYQVSNVSLQSHVICAYLLDPWLVFDVVVFCLNIINFRYIALQHIHYSDVIMDAMESRITGVSTVCSGAYQRKHQSSASLAFVRGIHPPVTVVPLTKGQ